MDQSILHACEQGCSLQGRQANGLLNRDVREKSCGVGKDRRIYLAGFQKGGYLYK